MNRQEIAGRFDSLTAWKNGDRRAPHKPLLVLLALGYLQNEDRRMLSYQKIEQKLEGLLTKFGTPRNATNTHYPFWRLQKEGIWEVERANELLVNSSGDVRKTELRKKNISAGFTEEAYSLLKKDSALATEVGWNILKAHFPDPIYEDIIHETGFSPEEPLLTRKRRDPISGIKYCAHMSINAPSIVLMYGWEPKRCVSKRPISNGTVRVDQMTYLWYCTMYYAPQTT